MILNRNCFFQIRSCGEPMDDPYWTPPTFSVCDDTILFKIRDYSDDDYWMFDIYHGDSFDVWPLDTLIPPNILSRIKSKSIKLLLINSHESYQSVVNGIYKDCIKYDIPVEQVILLSESYDILNEVRAISKKYNMGEIKVEWMLEFEYNAMNQKQNIIRSKKDDLITLVDKFYEKKYLSFNRNLVSRVHRTSIISLLCIRNLLDRGYVSAGFDKWQPDWTELLPGVRELFKNDEATTQLLADNEQRILNIGKLSLDSTTEKDHAWLTTDTDYLYRDTYFSVVTETNGFQWIPEASPWGGVTGCGRLVSEKTFKPVAHKHPFILVGIPNSLDLLRQLGYKTFSPWINESYDIEPDSAKRILMVVDEIERLSNLSPDQLTDFLNGVREICEYNYKNLMDKKIWTYKLN